MTKLKKECELLNHDIKDISVKINAARTKRVEFWKEAEPLFTTKLTAAQRVLTTAEADLTEVEEKAQARFFVPNVLKQEQNFAKQTRVMCQTMVSKLSKLAPLFRKISEEDRQRETLISQLQGQANDLVRLLPASASEAQLKQAQERLEALKKQINELYAQILESEKRIQRYYQLAKTYDEHHPEQFAAHWLEAATIILERDDAYGFIGTIIYPDLRTKQTPNTGLEAGSSVSYGTILQKNEVIQYTYSNTEIKLEQDHSGKITGKSVYKSEEDMNLAAIKLAKLLLMDCKLRKNLNIYIKGPKEVLPQTRRVIAALRVLAEEAGIDLEDDKGNSFIDVKVPGWNAEKMNADIETLMEGIPEVPEALGVAAQPAKPGIRAMIASRAKDEFKDIHAQLEATPDLAEDETVLRQPRGPGGFGVTT